MYRLWAGILLARDPAGGKDVRIEERRLCRQDYSTTLGEIDGISHEK